MTTGQILRICVRLNALAAILILAAAPLASAQAPQELGLLNLDLYRGHHLEWPSGAGGNVEVLRSGYAAATWKW